MLIFRICCTPLPQRGVGGPVCLFHHSSRCLIFLHSLPTVCSLFILFPSLLIISSPNLHEPSSPKYPQSYFLQPPSPKYNIPIRRYVIHLRFSNNIDIASFLFQLPTRSQWLSLIYLLAKNEHLASIFDSLRLDRFVCLFVFFLTAQFVSLVRFDFLKLNRACCYCDFPLRKLI